MSSNGNGKGSLQKETVLLSESHRLSSEAARLSLLLAGEVAGVGRAIALLESFLKRVREATANSRRRQEEIEAKMKRLERGATQEEASRFLHEVVAFEKDEIQRTHNFLAEAARMKAGRR